MRESMINTGKWLAFSCKENFFDIHFLLYRQTNKEREMISSAQTFLTKKHTMKMISIRGVIRRERFIFQVSWRNERRNNVKTECQIHSYRCRSLLNNQLILFQIHWNKKSSKVNWIETVEFPWKPYVDICESDIVAGQQCFTIEINGVCICL